MILVDVYVPSLDEKFDFSLDETVKISEIADELREVISRQSKSESHNSASDFMLYRMDERAALDFGRSLSECGVCDGMSLMMI